MMSYFGSIKVNFFPFTNPKKIDVLTFMWFWGVWHEEVSFYDMSHLNNCALKDFLWCIIQLYFNKSNKNESIIPCMLCVCLIFWINVQVFRHLVEKVHCRLLFATHYHPLTKEFASHPHVTLQHMACAFKAKTGSSVIGEQELVFLYRLTSGSCPESYGLQVALMAGIPKSAVESASNAGQRMKKLVGENFRSSEVRSEFSTLHEGWLKTLLAVSKISDCDLDEDALDTLLLLWHELKCFYRSHERKD